MSHTKLPSSLPNRNSDSKVSTKFLLDFSNEVNRFIEALDSTLEDLDYGIEEIVSCFYHIGLRELNGLGNYFYINGMVSNPIDANFAAAEASNTLYPELKRHCEYAGIDVSRIDQVEIMYEQFQDQSITCFAKIWVLE